MSNRNPTSSAYGDDASTRVLLERLVRNYIGAHWWRLGLALVFMAIVAGTTAAFTQLLKPIINDIFVAKQEDLLLPVAIAALAIFVAKGVAHYGQEVIMSFVGFRIVADLQRDLYERVLGADLVYFTDTSPGTLISRFINDCNMLRDAASRAITGAGKDFLTALVLAGVLIYEDWLLASFAILGFPLAIVPIVRVGRKVRRTAGRTQVSIGKLSTLLDETFQGIRHVKAYGMEPYERRRADHAVEDVFRLNFKIARNANILHPVMETLAGVAMTGVVLYGGALVIEGSKDPGSFFAFIVALILAYEPIKRLARLNTILQAGLSAAKRIFDLMDMEPQVVDAPDAKPLKIDTGEILLENVDFAYADGTKALKDVTIRVPGGRTAALVGASGAGKSTVLNLIPRFYDMDSGKIVIDGQNIARVTLKSLREHMALVSQEVLLFDDTVANNIAYGRPDASREEIIEAAKNASAHAFIEALPEGYETLVGPRGVKLSGGQRQRITIARAMLRNAPILLLDEATSALDTEAERKVQTALGELMTGRTTLVIAHRLSTIMGADIIYVLDDGCVIEQGTHSELLAKDGAYARLYTLQFAGQGEGGSEGGADEALESAPSNRVKA